MDAAQTTDFIIENGELTEFLGRNATSAVVPQGVRKIGLWAFAGCDRLTRVELPETVVEIGFEAFKGCTALKHITLPRGLKAMSDRAFSGCHSLTDLVIPDDLRLIGNRNFSNRKGRNLAAVPVDIGAAGQDDTRRLTPAKKAGDFLIHDGAVLQYFGTQPHVTVPGTVTAIKAQAFMGCLTLRTVTIPAGVEYIHDFAFSGCAGLSRVQLPQSAINFGQGVFDRCTGLAEINFSGRQSPGLFRGCTALKTLHLPHSMTSVSSNSYDGCTALRTVHAPGATEIARSWGFWATGNTEVIGCPQTALIAPELALDGVVGEALQVNCLLGYLSSPQSYTDAQAEQYRRLLAQHPLPLLEYACREGLWAIVHHYCQGGHIEAPWLPALLDIAQRRDHMEIAARLLDYQHAQGGGLSAAEQAARDIASLLEDL